MTQTEIDEHWTLLNAIINILKEEGLHARIYIQHEAPHKIIVFQKEHEQQHWWTPENTHTILLNNGTITIIKTTTTTQGHLPKTTTTTLTTLELSDPHCFQKTTQTIKQSQQ